MNTAPRPPCAATAHSSAVTPLGTAIDEVSKEPDGPPCAAEQGKIPRSQGAPVRPRIDGILRPWSLRLRLRPIAKFRVMSELAPDDTPVAQRVAAVLAGAGVHPAGLRVRTVVMWMSKRVQLLRNPDGTFASVTSQVPDISRRVSRQRRGGDGITTSRATERVGCAGVPNHGRRRTPAALCGSSEGAAPPAARARRRGVPGGRDARRAGRGAEDCRTRCDAIVTAVRHGDWCQPRLCVVPAQALTGGRARLAAGDEDAPGAFRYSPFGGNSHGGRWWPADASGAASSAPPG